MDVIMKTLRYREGNSVKPGIVDKEGKIRDASSIVNDWDHISVTVEKLHSVQSMDLTSLPVVDNNNFEKPVFLFLLYVSSVAPVKTLVVPDEPSKLP